ncbi:MAG TPA: DNA methyltransferase [Clostridia bacterium]|nr:DNA methyltransferase [Clostridia bacterium]
MKLYNPSTDVHNKWFSYYAGFSTNFVQSVIEELKLEANSVILDPWNGSGTTTVVAYNNGYNAIGYDINPATNVIAKSRFLRCELDELVDAYRKIIEIYNVTNIEQIDQYDMLNLWFPPYAGILIRKLERSIAAVFNIESGIHLQNAGENSESLAAFCYVALFDTVKAFLKDMISKNPTWNKDAYIEILEEENLLEMYDMILRKNFSVLQPLKEYQNVKPYIRISNGSSLAINLPDASVDCIITSPPYCTRIDYAVSMKVGLAIIGLSSADFKILRDCTIGTSTIHKKKFILNPEWGTEANSVLERIFTHSSYASQSYYFKTYWQYVNDCFASLCELNRVLKSNGKAVFVLQDSYYKDIHVDLAKIYIQMLSNQRWKMVEREDFEKPRTLVQINSKSKCYGQGTKRLESVLIFKKE